MEHVVVKLGGKAADGERLTELGSEIAELSSKRQFIVVHGGGAEVSAMSRRLGIEPVIRDGVRQTSAAEMDIVEMMLSGLVNKRLVRALRSAGLDAVGLSGSDGGIFSARPVAGDGVADSRTGEVAAIDRRLLDLLLAHGFLPVLSSTSFDEACRGMNVNADSVAFGIATELRASFLVFLSDVPGVLARGSVARELDSVRARQLQASGAITGGMLPKVAASLEAVARGVGAVIIGQYESAGSLSRLLAGAAGTRIGARMRSALNPAT